MGLEVKRNAKGEYQLKSTISGELYHDEKWVSEDEAKRCLIESAYCKFLEEAVKIDMEFPGHYRVNDKREKMEGEMFGEWWLKHKCRLGPLFERFEEVSKRLNLDLTLEK